MIFIETSTFTKQLPRHLDDDSYSALQAFLSVHPDADVMRGTGGVRKIRWGMTGRGMRGGSRVKYYWLAKEDHIYLLSLYAKGVKDDLTVAERVAWRRAVEAIDNDWTQHRNGGSRRPARNSRTPCRQAHPQNGSRRI